MGRLGQGSLLLWSWKDPKKRYKQCVLTKILHRKKEIVKLRKLIIVKHASPPHSLSLFTRRKHFEGRARTPRFLLSGFILYTGNTAITSATGGLTFSRSINKRSHIRRRKDLKSSYNYCFLFSQSRLGRLFGVRLISVE